MRSTWLRLLTTIAILAVGMTSALGAIPRTETADYTGFAYTNAGPAEIYGYCSSVNGEYTGGSACFTPRPDERHVRITVEDETGLDVAALLVRKGMRDVAFCGSTDGPVRIPARKEFAVAVSSGGCGGGPGAPTKGVITVTFRL
jgi:hypothetical protein